MSLNPWVALILGILIGWLLQWLLELWFFRRRRTECQQRLSQVEADLQTREVELRNARAHAESLEADLTALRVKPAAAFTPLGGDLAAPQVGVALSEVERPEVEVAAPQVDVALSEVERPEVGVAAPQVGVALPEVERPEVEVAAPQVGVALPEVERPEVEVAAPQVGVALSEVERPEVDTKLPEAGVDWPALSAEIGRAEIGAPELNLGASSIGAELPAPAAGLPEAAMEALAPVDRAEFVADDLTRVSGIGPKYAAQLAAAGITSYAALSAAQPDQLKAIINAPDWRRVDYAAWIAGASALLKEPHVGGAGDDLTVIEGIGAVYAAKLNAAGITTFAELAATDESRLSDIIQAPAWRRTNYDEWITQARLAAAGDEEGLKALQARLFNRVRRAGQEG